MVIWRTSLATLVVVAVAGLASGQEACAPPACGSCGGCQKGECQKGSCQKDCGKGGKGCSPGGGLVTCCGECQGCTMTCDALEIHGNAFRCECTTICLPAQACNDGCGKDCDKDCDACDPKDVGKGGKGFGDLLNLWTCKPHVKKRLLMKNVVVCDLPIVVCDVDKVKGAENIKGGKGCDCHGQVQPMPDDTLDGVPEVPLPLPEPEPIDPVVPAPIEGDEGIEFEPISDVPEPPAASMSRRLRRVVPTPTRRRTSSGGLFDLLLR